MAQFTDTPKLLPEEDLDKFKYELSCRLDLTPQITNDYWGYVTSRDCGKVGGKIGGNLVKIMIRHEEQSMSQNKV